MARETRQQQTETAYTKRSGESQHSHVEYGSTHVRWDRDSGSDFAITSVNLPDRLDTQEVRARAAADSERPSVRRLHRADAMRIIGWLIVALIVGALAWAALRIAMPLRAAISPAGVEASVGAALGAPVSVAETRVDLSPSPRLVVTGMVAQSGFQLPKIELHFNWRAALEGLQSSKWVLGEARVAPVQLTGAQALALLNSVHGASRLPAAVSTIRFEAIEFPDVFLLPGRYEAVVRRGAEQGAFSAISLKRLDGDGEMELEIRPPTTAGGAASFALFARKWATAIGPAIVWSEATAQGELRGDLVKVDSYSVGGQFGNLNGAAQLSKEAGGWRLAGNVRSPDLAVEQVIRRAAGLGGDAAALAAVPLRGTAKFDLTVSGFGASAEETLQRATVGGPVSVAGATFVGLNFGLVASQGRAEGAGGTTRFTDLGCDVVVTRDGLSVRNVAGRAGGLRVHGGFQVDRKLQLSGSLRPEVASPRGVIGAEVRLGGTAAAPTYH
jgi:hypothetical protein